MKKYMLIVMIGVAVLLSACSADPQTTEKVGNDIQLELLFEKDGIKVYRFEDMGRAIYFTDARGKTEWTQTNGQVSRKCAVETVE